MKKKKHGKKAVEDWIKKQSKKLFIWNGGYISIGDCFQLCPICFCISKIFLKKFKNYLFFSLF